MSLPPAAPPPTVGHEPYSGASMWKSRRWLSLARLGWIVLVVLALGLFIASIPTYFAFLHVPCTGTFATCRNNGQITPEDLRALQTLGLSLDFFATYWTVLYIVFTTIFAAVGIVIFWRRSDDRMALLASLTLVLFPLAFNSSNLATLPAAWSLPSQLVAVLGDSFMFLFFYLFPTGRFVPRWTRWLWNAVIVFWVVNIFFSSPSFNSSLLFAVLILSLVCSALVAQVYRYRWVSNAVQRQQTKWVVFGISSGLGGFLLLLLSFALFPSLTTQSAIANLITGTAVYLFFLLIPLSISVAILRSRLFDIDLIINRTLVYGTLTALLALIYFGSIIALQSLVSVFTGHLSPLSQAPLVLVASTLVIAALIQPLRRRIQVIIDRRFFRSKYDTARTLAAFSATLRDEVDLKHLSKRLVEVVQETMQPTHVSLWLCSPETNLPPVSIAPDDPIVAYFLSAPGLVEVDKLPLDSPVVQALKAAQVKVVVPMINQGKLVGLLNLGPRRSAQDYSQDDRGLLNTLATQAAPAVRVAQLVQQQQIQARERERLEQEMRVAHLIQQTLLPKELPVLPGWQLAAYYQPARAVGGDFYDFLSFADGRLGIVIGDVTDKGVPAALLMATTRSILRSIAQGEASPGNVLEQTNELLCPDIPPNMFVTCLYAILEPSSGRLLYANAGQDLPYHRCKAGVFELRATGMPLGLMPGMRYEEKETTLATGESILFYSDGLVEAHNWAREMFSFPRLVALLGEQRGGEALIAFLLDQLAAFTGPGWEQEDDVTLVTLQRLEGGEDTA